MGRSNCETGWWLLGLAFVTAAVASGADPDDDAPGRLRVMSFNIRYGTARDGDDSWPLRRDRVVHAIRRFAPDLLGTQETLAFQRDELLLAFPGFAVLAAGRDDGREAGEMTAIFYVRDRFEPVASGHLWLSPTPDVPGSRGWDAALPRIASWVRLRDRELPEEPPLLFLNTHFDHVGEQARLESARLLRRKAGELGAGCRIVVAGDFNAAEATPPYAALFTDDAEGPRLVDSFRTLAPRPSGPEGTFNRFDPAVIDGPRIDWIGCSADWRVIAAGIDRTVVAGRTPSDHWAVTTTLTPVPSRPREVSRPSFPP
jgi:endonuclease/exonuclease/phosphatase family metal-dependent hydrolase